MAVGCSTSRRSIITISTGRSSPVSMTNLLAALLLLGLSVLCVGLSLVLFARRDIGRPAFSWQRQSGKRQPPGDAQPEPGRACCLNAHREPAHPRRSGLVFLLVAARHRGLLCLYPAPCSQRPAGVLQNRASRPPGCNNSFSTLPPTPTPACWAPSSSRSCQRWS